MNRVLLSTLLGILFEIIDILITLRGDQPDRTSAILLQAFFSRFAIGVLAANVSLPVHTVLAGALVGFLISLPDAFALHSYAGILGSGLLFGIVTALAAKAWGRQPGTHA